jgi:hypothetical protein
MLIYSTLLNQLIGFHETWYERYVIGGHSIALILISTSLY